MFEALILHSRELRVRTGLTQRRRKRSAVAATRQPYDTV